MRGSDRRSGELFSYVDVETRVRSDHPLRAIRSIVNETLEALSGEFDGALRGRRRAAVDPAGDAAAGDAAAGVLHDPLGAPADGAARVRPLVPLVRRAFGGRAGLGPFDLLEEPRPPARRRGRGEVPRRGADPAQGEAAAVDPALQRRRDADRGLGEPEVVQAQARRGRGSGRSARGRRGGDGDGRAQRRGRLQGREALERDASLDHRSRGAALSQGAGHGGEALLHRPWADGEPLRADRRRAAHPGLGPRRAAGRAGDDRAACRIARAPSRSAPTRATTRPTSSRSCGR